MTIPKITPYTGGVANPDGSQTQTEFTQNMFDQLSYEAELSTELNNTVDGINDTATQVDSDATSASQSAAAAEAAVSGLNYQGLWPDTGGIANKGDTYQTQVSGVPTGQYFTALQNTVVEPVSDNVNWRYVGGYSIKTFKETVNSAVDNMIIGFPSPADIGDWCSTGGTVWERIANTGQLSDFRHITPINIRDFGVKGDGSDPTSAIDTVLSRLGGDFTLMFPDGQYSGFNNFYSNATFITSENTVFNGVVHAAISGGPILNCENVRFIGTIVTSDRVGTYDCDNVVIDAIRQIDGNRGVHFYFNTKNLYVDSIHVEGLLNADTETSNAVFIDGTTGKAASENIYIGRIVADNSANGAFSALKLDSSVSSVSSITVGEIISTNSDYDLFCLGDGSSENNFEVRTLRSNGGDQDIVYMQNVDGLKVGKITASANKGGGVVRQAGSNKNINVGDTIAKAVGQNTGLSDDRRGAINLINPLGFSLKSLLVDGVGGTNALNINNATGGRIEIGKFEVRNPSLRAVVFGSDFRNVRIKELIISGAASDGAKGVSSSVIENVDIDYMFVDGATTDGMRLENTQITDFTIGKFKATTCGQDGFSITNAINDADGLKIGSLVTKGNTRFGAVIQNQDEGIYINNIQSSGNLQGLRAIDAIELNINGGHITGNTEGLSTAGTVTGWLVNGLRVDGNTTNGTLPPDTVTGNVIAP